MRFVFAIVAFVAAAVLIMFGLAQRAAVEESATARLATTVKSGTAYTVIEPSALTAHRGSQTLTVEGSGPIFVAYGRSSDVTAWIAGDPYTSVVHKRGAARLTATEPGSEKPGTETPATEQPTTEEPATEEPAAEAPAEPAAEPPAEPAAEESEEPSGSANPAGSDLWLEEFTGEQELTTTINVPKGISVIVASDGSEPAPEKIAISWPVNNTAPLAMPLIIAGGILGVIGLALYLWALLHLRRSRRPRRNVPRGPKMPRLPRPPRPKAIKASQITRGSITQFEAQPQRGPLRRALLRATPVVVVSGLLLSGCSADFLPASSTPSAKIADTPDATAVPDAAKDVPPPAVTVPQLERILRKTAVLTADADATLNAETLATRFTGPALEQRAANYKIRAAIPDHAALPALPAAPITLTLPQQTSTWPRVVMAIVQNEDDPTLAPTALVLRQETPRANYQVEYAVQLEAAAEVPAGVAPATIGAPPVDPRSKLLMMAPEKIAAAYADILTQGEASPSFGAFEAEGDTFRTQVGVEYKNNKRATLPTTASIEFLTEPGAGKIVSLATVDSGALVAVSLKETETVKPIDAGATVSPEKASKALSGVEATAKGIQSVYSDQLLFHVPAAGSDEKIVLLGFAQGLISSAELP